MASQQGAPSRPWFRLATMARPPAPQPTPAPAPPQPQPIARPTFIRPAFTQPQPAPAPAPPQPQPQPIARPTFIRPAFTQPQPPSPTTPMPPSSRTPPLQQSAATLTATMPPPINIRATSSPPKTLEKTPPPSPNVKPLSHPPSPLALPSPQLKSYDPPQYDQKTVLVQEKPKATNFNNGDLHTTHNPKNGPKKLQVSKNHLDSEDLGMTIITISGENKGAVMDLTPFGNNKTSHNNPHSLHMKKDNYNPTASSDADKSGTDSDGKKKTKKNQVKSPLMSTAVMNSNVQAVNNSILYNCSTTHHDPGIHLSLSRNPTAGRAFLHKDHIN